MKRLSFLWLFFLAIGLYFTACKEDSIIPIEKQITPTEDKVITDDLSFRAIGDPVAEVMVPVPSAEGIGIGIAINCDNPPTMYYTNSYDPTLYKMTPTGTNLGSVPLTDAASGAPISFGAISWDQSRNKIWAGTDQEPGTFIKVYLVDPGTGVATYIFTLTQGLYGFCDGIAFDGTDNSVWISDDVSDWIEHWDVSAVDAAGVGTPSFINSIIPKNSIGGTLGLISGVAVGKGDVLYLGQNGRGQIVKVTKSGNYLSMFASPGGRDEDLECDLISFAPMEVLWSKDAYDDHVDAIEVETGTCICGGGGALEVPFDIKPGSCPNPLNTKSQGILPAAILGTSALSVGQIDVASVALEGVAPVNFNLEDVATPFEPFTGKADCYQDCNTLGYDGFMDLTLKFNTQDIVAALGTVTDGECRVLKLTGLLLDGTAIEGEDVVIIIKKKN